MWVELEMVLSSYKPLSLEKGMWFVQKLHQGTIKETIELFELERVPQDQEQFIQQNGYPVEVKIVNSDGEVVVLPHEIGWWDEGDHTDELRDITIKDLNLILEHCNGVLDVLLEEADTEDGISYFVCIVEGKVVIRYVQEEEYDDDE